MPPSWLRLQSVVQITDCVYTKYQQTCCKHKKSIQLNSPLQDQSTELRTRSLVKSRRHSHLFSLTVSSTILIKHEGYQWIDDPVAEIVKHISLLHLNTSL